MREPKILTIPDNCVDCALCNPFCYDCSLGIVDNMPDCPGEGRYSLVPVAQWEAAKEMCDEVLRVTHDRNWVMGQLARRAMGEEVPHDE